MQRTHPSNVPVAQDGQALRGAHGDAFARGNESASCSSSDAQLALLADGDDGGGGGFDDGEADRGCFRMRTRTRTNGLRLAGDPVRSWLGGGGALSLSALSPRHSTPLCDSACLCSPLRAFVRSFPCTCLPLHKLAAFAWTSDGYVNCNHVHAPFISLYVPPRMRPPAPPREKGQCQLEQTSDDGRDDDGQRGAQSRFGAGLALAFAFRVRGLRRSDDESAAKMPRLRFLPSRWAWPLGVEPGPAPAIRPRPT